MAEMTKFFLISLLFFCIFFALVFCFSHLYNLTVRLSFCLRNLSFNLLLFSFRSGQRHLVGSTNPDYLSQYTPATTAFAVCLVPVQDMEAPLELGQRVLYLIINKTHTDTHTHTERNANIWFTSHAQQFK